MSQFNKRICIEGRDIGPGQPCYVIAEGGVNHFGDLEKAFALVDAAVTAGADAFKTQHYQTEKLVCSDALEWKKRLKPKELSNEDLLRVRDYCDQKKINFLCTAHDEISLAFLENENLTAHKIGSGEVENWPYIAEIARTGKPALLSTGMYTINQVQEAVALFKEAGNANLAILHCHTGYPSQANEVNLSAMNEIRKEFRGPVGYSDHTVGTTVALAAVALGADIIEKHITIDRDVPNANDWIVSCDPEQLQQFIIDIRTVEDALGNGSKLPTEHEKKSLMWARKSVVSKTKIERDSVITRRMLTVKRPGTGVSPKHIESIIGRTAKVDIDVDRIIQNEDLL